MVDPLRPTGPSKLNTSRLSIRDDILRSVRVLASQEGGPVMPSAVRRFFTDSQVIGQFGSYDLLFGQAKILPNKFSPPQLLQLLKDFADSLDHIPTAADIDHNLNVPASSVYVSHFGTLEAAFKRAHLKPKLVSLQGSASLEPASMAAPSHDSYVAAPPKLSLVPKVVSHPLASPEIPETVRPRFIGTLALFGTTDPIDLTLLSGIWDLPFVAPYTAASWGDLRRYCRKVGVEFATHIVHLAVESGAIPGKYPRYMTVEFFQNATAGNNEYAVDIVFGDAPAGLKSKRKAEPDRIVFERHSGKYEVTELTGVLSTSIVLAIVEGELRREQVEEGDIGEEEDTPPLPANAAGGRVFAPDFDDDVLRTLFPKPEEYLCVDPDLRPLITPMSDFKVGPLATPADAPAVPKLEGFSTLSPEDHEVVQLPPSVLIPTPSKVVASGGEPVAVDLPEYIGSDVFLPEPPMGMILVGDAVLLGGLILGAAAMTVEIPAGVAAGIVRGVQLVLNPARPILVY